MFCDIKDQIPVAESVRHHGVGGKMITALWKKYEMAIGAETDDDAVDSYRRRNSGFTFRGQIDALDEGDPELFFVRQKAV